MNKFCFLPLFLLASILLMLSGCDVAEQKQEFNVESTVNITNLDELNLLFTEFDYTDKNWKTQDRTIPRISITAIHKGWGNGSDKLPVKIKKSIFFRLITPLILISNERILAERLILEKAPLQNEKLIAIATKYRVIKNKNTPLTEALREKLLQRVDIIPVSLALAQSAEESGWGTSRFAIEGNALFGQWDFTGNGMKPKQQREALGNYGVAKFDSPLESVESYMLNINSNAAYLDLRVLRAELRKADQAITGYQLANKLDKYSERGLAYVNGLHSLINYNKLQTTDKLNLADDQWIHLNIK